MAMLAQCAKSACTLQTIWGFTLSPNEVCIHVYHVCALAGPILFIPYWNTMVSTVVLQYTIVKLEVIGKEVVVTQYPSCQHDLVFTNFIPLMGLSQRK